MSVEGSLRVGVHSSVCPDASSPFVPLYSQTVFWGNDVDANGASPVFYEGELEGFSFIR